MKKILVLIALTLPVFSMAQNAKECETVIASPANLQATMLKGIVSDVKDRSPLDDVAVMIKSKATAETKTIETNEKGAFVFTNIPAGEYEISFQRKGYKPFNYDAVWVTEGKTCSLGFPLYKM